MVNNLILSAYAWVTRFGSSVTESMKDENGQDVIEYAVLVGAIGIALFAALVLVPLPAAFTTFGNKIANCVKFDPSC